MSFLPQKMGCPEAGLYRMSRGGEYSYIWATTHPDKVSCFYADNTGGQFRKILRDSVNCAAMMCPCFMSTAAWIPYWEVLDGH